jgi:hypothetical protein
MSMKYSPFTIHHSLATWPLSFPLSFPSSLPFLPLLPLQILSLFFFSLILPTCNVHPLATLIQVALKREGQRLGVLYQISSTTVATSSLVSACARNEGRFLRPHQRDQLFRRDLVLPDLAVSTEVQFRRLDRIQKGKEHTTSDIKEVTLIRRLWRTS